MIKIRLNTDKLPELNNEGLNKLVQEVTLAVRSEVIEATPVLSGQAKASWTTPKDASDSQSFGPVRRTGLSFGNTQEYSKPLSFGSKLGFPPWPGPGPRTYQEGNRIYSKQAPGGIFEAARIEEVAKKTAQMVLERIFSRNG